MSFHNPLGPYIISRDNKSLSQLKKDMKDIVDFFLPVKDKISKELAEINKNIYSVYKWNDDECAYISNILRFNEKRVNIESILYKILLDYLKENKRKWESYFSKREFFNANLERGFCYFSLRIILRLINGKTNQEAFDTEFTDLLKIRKPYIKHIKRIVIQNLSLTEDVILKFNQQILDIKGIEQRWDENNVQKSCKVNDFSLKFKIYLRRMNVGEFESITINQGFYAQSMNISTYLEIIYQVPNEYYARFSEIDFQYMMSSGEISSFLDIITSNVITALKLSSGNYIYPVEFNPEYYNYYMNKFFSKSIPLRKKRYLYEFFTEALKLTPDRFLIVSDIFDFLMQNLSNEKINRLLTIIDRADLAIYNNMLFISIAMYRSFLESILDKEQKSLIEQASYLSGSTISQKELLKHEKLFWDVITKIRNSYIHGDSIKKIEKIINKHYHDQDIGSLTLATREKIFRAFLFILLLNKQSPHWRIFNSDKKFIFKYPLKFFKFQTKFYEWIQYGTEMELGKLEKFKRITGLRLINI